MQQYLQAMAAAQGGGQGSPFAASPLPASGGFTAGMPPGGAPGASGSGMLGGGGGMPWSAGSNGGGGGWGGSSGWAGMPFWMRMLGMQRPQVPPLTPPIPYGPSLASSPTAAPGYAAQFPPLGGPRPNYLIPPTPPAPPAAAAPAAAPTDFATLLAAQQANGSSDHGGGS